jgi:hypothetical protein
VLANDHSLDVGDDLLRLFLDRCHCLDASGCDCFACPLLSVWAPVMAAARYYAATSNPVSLANSVSVANTKTFNLWRTTEGRSIGRRSGPYWWFR